MSYGDDFGAVLGPQKNFNSTGSMG